MTPTKRNRIGWCKLRNGTAQVHLTALTLVNRNCRIIITQQHSRAQNFRRGNYLTRGKSQVNNTCEHQPPTPSHEEDQNLDNGLWSEDIVVKKSTVYSIDYRVLCKRRCAPCCTQYTFWQGNPQSSWRGWKTSHNTPACREQVGRHQIQICSADLW